MRVAALIALAMLLVACGSASPGGTASGSPGPTATVSTPASPSPSPSITPSASPSSLPTPSPASTPLACLPLAGGTSSRATITDVRVGTHAGYDRLVIEFAGGLPAYKLVAQDPTTFVGPASGIPVSVSGSAGIHLFIYNMDIPPSYQHGTNLKPGYSVLEQVVVLGVFEGQADIAIGLGGASCPTVSTLSGPSRLVIDFPTA